MAKKTKIDSMLYIRVPLGVHYYLNELKSNVQFKISTLKYSIVMGFLVYRWYAEKKQPFKCTTTYVAKGVGISDDDVRHILPFLKELNLIYIEHGQLGMRKISINEDKILELDRQYREYIKTKEDE